VTWKYIKIDSPVQVQINKVISRAYQGENVAVVKLIRKQVIKIRNMHATGKYTCKQLAKRFGVGRNCITHIIRGVSWAWLKQPG